MRISVALMGTCAATAAVLAGQIRAGAGGTPCESLGQCPGPAAGPDVIVGGLEGLAAYGAIGGISAYAFGTESCNVGDTVLLWDADTPWHPVIAQNLYRYFEGRFEQVGMSWLKHGFAALTDDLCCTCQNPLNSQLLGVGCSDLYTSSLNGDQDGTGVGCLGTCGGLGPRYEVNATTGAFAYPYDRYGEAGDAIDKRLQVHNTDIDPVLNPGAEYFGEGHYVTFDDAQAANHHNNASWREVLISIPQDETWVLVFSGDTRRGCPAIYAWQQEDPEVVIEVVEDDNDPAADTDGRFYLGYRVTDNGDGTWHYEYALYNMNSHKGCRSFGIPVPAGVNVTNIDFHDVDYHSGDGPGGVNYDGADWTVTAGGDAVTWSTDSWGADVHANALRWGTLYNFRFDADRPPVETEARMLSYRPSVEFEFFAPTLGPQAPVEPCPWDITGDDIVDIVDFLELLMLWGTDPGGPPDFNGDGNVGVEDFLELLAQWGPCPLYASCGAIGSGGCFEANGTPGCAHQSCCETVCDISPECCEVAWDAACKDQALALCGNCGSPDAGDCCIFNGTPGCDDLTCCEAVCAQDAFCCTGLWDGLCAEAAETLCGCG